MMKKKKMSAECYPGSSMAKLWAFDTINALCVKMGLSQTTVGDGLMLKQRHPSIV